MNAPLALHADAIMQERPRKVLLLAQEFVAQYRVLRAVAMTGAAVHIMGPEKARALALSRYCAAYHPFFFGHEAYLGIDEPVDARKIAAHIDDVAFRHGLALVLAGDALTTRLLCEMQPYLQTKSFPVPDLATFDSLATKDAFMKLCHSRSILHPRGHVFPRIDALAAAIAAGKVAFPSIVKPLNRAGSIGVVRIDRHNAGEILSKIDYAPVLVQDFVEGEDRCITVMAIGGAIVKEVVYWHPEGVFTFGRQTELSRIVGDIAGELNLTGVFNFDARIALDGRVWMIECNPRFFFNMDVAAIAGINFAALDDVSPGQCAMLSNRQLRVPQSTFKELLRLRWPATNDWKMLRHWMADPLVFGLVSSGFPRHWRAQWLERFAARLRAA
jgi:hypothetical protein